MSQTVDGVSARAEPFDAVDRLLAAIRRNPRMAFAVFILVHTILWTLVPSLLSRSVPLDVVEGVAHGRDWQLSYWKHPPLPWLVLDIVHRIAAGRIWAFFLLGQLSADLALWAVWRLGRELFGEIEAFAGVVLLDGYIDFNMNPGVFNHNVLQLPLFALAGWSLYRAFVRGKLGDWLLVGLWFALAFYTKYEAIVLLAPAVAFSVVEPEARRSWRTPGPYVAAVVCAALVAPQVLWMGLVDHFSALKFADDKAAPARSLIGLVWGNTVFTADALVYVIPIAALFLVWVGRTGWARRPQAPSRPDSSDAFARRYLAFLTFGPLATALAIGLFTDRILWRGWSEQFWCFTSLYLIAAFRPPTDLAGLRRLFVGWCGLTGLFVTIRLVHELFLVGHGSLLETQFPGARFSGAVTSAWHTDVGPAPLPYVVGDFWSAGNVVLFSPERPRMFENGDRIRSPRVDPDDVRRRGAVILLPPQVGLNKLPHAAKGAPWLAEFPAATVQPPFVVRQQTLRGEIDWVIGWALLKPQASPVVPAR